MGITIDKVLRLAKRRVASKNCPEVEYFETTTGYRAKMVFTKDSSGVIILEAVFNGDAIKTLYIKKNGGQYTCIFNKVGTIIQSSINTYDNESLKSYQFLNDVVYLNVRDNRKKHLLTHYNYDQDAKKTYVREKIAYDVLKYGSYPINGEVIKYTKCGKVSARYVYMNGKKHNYRDVINCEKDKMVISLRNEKMVWVRQ